MRAPLHIALPRTTGTKQKADRRPERETHPGLLFVVGPRSAEVRRQARSTNSASHLKAYVCSPASRFACARGASDTYSNRTYLCGQNRITTTALPSILWDDTRLACWRANLEADPEDTQKFLNFLPDSAVIYRKSIFDTSVLGSIFTQRTVL